MNSEITVYTKHSVAVDAMSTERGIDVAVKGAIDAFFEFEDRIHKIYLVGDINKVEKSISDYRSSLKNAIDLIKTKNIIITSSTETISSDDGPREWVSKKNSSMHKCLELATENYESKPGIVVVTAGNSGAAGMLAKKRFGMVKGLTTPQFTCRVPTKYHDKFVLMGDVGLMVDYTPETIAEFAVVQSYYLKLCGVNEPRIGLLNIGEEPKKGSKVLQNASELLEKYSEQGMFKYVGNKEPTHIVNFEADGVVCGADLGNMYIKSGAANVRLMQTLIKNFKDENKVLALFAAPFLYLMKKYIGKRLDPSNYGGAPILGTRNGKAVKTHGSSDALAVKMAIKNALDYSEMESFASGLENILAEKRIDFSIKNK